MWWLGLRGLGRGGQDRRAILRTPTRSALTPRHKMPLVLFAVSEGGGDRLPLPVFATDAHAQAVVCAVLDNLGKGASGQAVHNMNLMLGLPETAGLAPEPRIP